MCCFHTGGGTLSATAVAIHEFSWGVIFYKIYTIIACVLVPWVYTRIYLYILVYIGCIHESGGQGVSLLNALSPYTVPWVLKWIQVTGFEWQELLPTETSHHPTGFLKQYLTLKKNPHSWLTKKQRYKYELCYNELYLN